MRMRRCLVLLVALLALTDARAQKEDSIASSNLLELQVIASPREDGAMRKQPASVSLIDRKQLEELHTSSLKGVDELVPNFYMPDYGSRMSSAVYIRGIGSRINSPAVGLYVDDVPVPDKSAYDLCLYDIQRLDILRGPQSTLYGAGTMGGVMKVYTRNPFDYQGTDISAGYATRDNTRRFSFMHYSLANSRFAWSFGGFYTGGDGFFKNSFNDLKQDHTSSGGVRFRAMAKTRRQWLVDAGANLDINNEGAYPYYYVGRQDGKAEDHANLLHRISSNQKGLYDRFVARASVKAQKEFKKLEISSISSFQMLQDTMHMDQDFLSADIYTLAQKQHNYTLTQDVLMKSRKPGRWQWISGITASMLHSKYDAPVTFMSDGMEWLNSLINDNANAHMPVIAAGPMSMQFQFDDRVLGDRLLFDSRFRTSNITAGAFHQSTYHDLFGVKGLSATVGLRLNLEMQELSYSSAYNFSHAYQLNGHLSMPGGIQKDIAMVPQQEFAVQNGLYSSDHSDVQNGIVATSPIRDTYLQLLPRFALQYDLGNTGNLYATVSRGYRSGGYNAQNISEQMRSLMTRDMMQDVRDVTLPVMESQPMVPADKKEMIAGMLNGMASVPVPDIEEACTYRPEYAWNYEVGTHLNFLQGRLSMDASAFLSSISDLQLSQMSETGLGRIMVNAGKSRSIGAELSLKARPVNALLLQASYGYTHATFLDYSDYDSRTNSLVECEGNYVPFMPQHTVNADAAYTFHLRKPLPPYYDPQTSFRLTDVTFGASMSGAGRIYWTEQNDASQPFYAMLGARLTLSMSPMEISFWGRNLTDTHYNTFWFVSADRAYEQHGKPLQVGFDVKVSF